MFVKQTTEEKVSCLREIPATVISKVQWNSYSKILQFFSAPTIDGEFLPKDPMEMLEEGDFKKIPLLIGSNQDEGEILIKYFALYISLITPNYGGWFNLKIIE